MIAEQAADADDPRQRLLPQRARRLRGARSRSASDQRADRKCHRRELKGGNFAGRHRQRGEQRPHQDRGQAATAVRFIGSIVQVSTDLSLSGSAVGVRATG